MLEIPVAELETIDAGKPISESRNVDVPVAAEVIQYYAGWASKIVAAWVASIRSRRRYSETRANTS